MQEINYSTDGEKIKILKNMIASCEDGYYEDAPDPDDYGMRLKRMLVDVVKFIEKNGYTL